MTISKGFAELLSDALAPLGQVVVRRMFGGGGVYCGGVMFGLVADDTLYLKADETTTAAFEAEGCGPFVFEGKGKPMTMSYWRMPERLLDDPEEMVAWAAKALAVAAKGAAAKAKVAARKGDAAIGRSRKQPAGKR